MKALQQLVPLMALLSLWQPVLNAQVGSAPAPDRVEEAEPSVSQTARVAWYTSWDQAQKDAARLNLPILVQSAAPQCRAVPGMW
ncbi:MAG TPA: hypothetical protein EYQ25_06100 [Planctomycetes bacterium]|nr:hypothetical protein [Planctomycetota bacterium]HIL36713.1 hypothetical protein [Planctomycetota bacterium]